MSQTAAVHNYALTSTKLCSAVVRTATGWLMIQSHVLVSENLFFIFFSNDIIGQDSPYDGDESFNIWVSQADGQDLSRTIVYPIKSKNEVKSE